MKEAVSYSEAFKLRLVEDVAAGKYGSLDEARRRNGIRGSTTVRKRIKPYGREDILPKRVKVETMNGIDELKEARKPHSGLPLSGVPAARLICGTRMPGALLGCSPQSYRLYASFDANQELKQAQNAINGGRGQSPHAFTYAGLAASRS